VHLLFFAMAALFVVQTMVGAASQHHPAELTDFFGVDLASAFPYNLMGTWHIQLALFGVPTSFVAAGIFLAPMIARRAPKHQGRLAFALLGALAVVVLGTPIGRSPASTACCRTWRRTGSACRASSTTTSRGSGRCCCPSACSSGCSCSSGGPARAAAQQAPPPRPDT
jgi:nitric oxide reductase large subunit